MLVKEPQLAIVGMTGPIGVVTQRQEIGELGHGRVGMLVIDGIGVIASAGANAWRSSGLRSPLALFGPSGSMLWAPCGFWLMLPVNVELVFFIHRHRSKFPHEAAWRTRPTCSKTIAAQRLSSTMRLQARRGFAELLSYPQPGPPEPDRGHRCREG